MSAAPGRGLLIAALAIAAAMHLVFSPLGFNPTDDGFVLAASRRLLDGQIPHRDFISIRPLGSALLHAPEVWLGGSLTYWWSRLVVCVEFAVIAWAWVRLCAQGGGRAIPHLTGTSLLLVALVLSAHTFPLMAWHTVDGLALASLGLVLAASPARMRLAGYALIGGAALCKQNFALFAPVALLVLGDARRPAAWISVVAPGLLYAAWLAVTGALGDAVAQIGSQTDILKNGVLTYATHPWTGGGAALGFLCVTLARGRGPASAAVIVAAVMMLGVAAAMLRPDATYSGAAAFLLFGATLGALVRGCWPASGAANVRTSALALGLAWSASISIGYASPALAAGPLAIALFDAVLPVPAAAGGTVRWPRYVLPLLALAMLAIWTSARHEIVYRDLPASQLSHPLDDVLPGGRWIRSSPNTHALLADLQRAAALTRGRPYAIVSDFPGWWVQSPARNPLSIDWPQEIELNRPELERRVIADLEAMRGRGAIIAHRISVLHVAAAFAPVRADLHYYFAIAYARARFRKVAETEWFEIYE